MFGFFRFLINGLIMVLIIQELFYPELADPYKWYHWISVIIIVSIFNWEKRD